MAKPMDNLLVMLTTTHSLEPKVPNPPQMMVTPRGLTEEMLGNEEVVLIEEEEEEVSPLDWKQKGVVFLPEPSKKPKRSATPSPSTDSGIPVKVENFPAPLTILLTPTHPDEERIQLFIAKHNYTVDQLDWFKRYLGSSLAHFSSEMRRLLGNRIRRLKGQGRDHRLWPEGPSKCLRGDSGTHYETQGS
uniref:Uncharacterized protein n=1 Tax=Cannabis sativa TaxID=3483 RepID=A0A803Q2N2_CANSA